MSARLARVFVSTGAAALALGLVAPTAALADAGGNGKGIAPSAQSSAAPGKSATAGDNGNNASAPAGGSATAKNDPGKPAHAGKAAHAGKPAKPGKSKTAGTTHGAGKGGSSKGDPAGNNGTIKIELFGSTDGNANHPHPGCAFTLAFFKFDSKQKLTATFDGQAPTPSAVSFSGSFPYQVNSDGNGSLSFADPEMMLGLTGDQAKQGYHIKVMVNADNAPGGAKQKVFWLKCAKAESAGAITPKAPEKKSDSTSSSNSAATSGNNSAAGSASTTVTKTEKKTATTQTGTTSGAAAAAAQAPLAGSTGQAAVGGSAPQATTPLAGGSAAAALSPARQASRRSQGGALPFTGLPLLGMLALGLGVLVAGVFAVRAGRRRTGHI